MRTIDLTNLSLGSILAYRLRSALTVLGILVGITAVVLLTSIGEGVRLFVLGEFTRFGTNLIAVTPGKSDTFGGSQAVISTVRPLTLGDAEALAKLQQVDAVVPLIQGNASVEFVGRSRRTMVFGVSSQVPDVWQLQVGSGRFLPADDYRAARPFAVLGAKMKDELFGEQNPLGKRIRVGGDRYRVVGVMEAKGQMLGFDLDDTIYIPISKAIEMFNRESLMEIDLVYANGESAASVAKNIERVLIARHGHEDFTLVTQDKMLEVLDSVLNVLTLGVAALGGISLLVGAVGILTIMTIAVTERTSEIGLLRAIGARRRDILRLFLAEAMALGLLGGVGGIAVAVGLVGAANLLLPDLPLAIAGRYVLSALGLATLIGLAAGILPALRAAGMQPVEALRAE